MAWPSVFCKYSACRNIKLKLFHFISFTDFPRQIVTFYQEISISKGVVQGWGWGVDSHMKGFLVSLKVCWAKLHYI